MEPDSYSTIEVIEALQSVGVAEEVIEYLVPIAAYESRVDGVPFTRDALDKESPSWGIFQANLDSMAPGIYKAMKELGVEVPGVTEEQDNVLVTNNAQPGQENLLDFTSEQKEFVANWFKTEANLKDNALVFKYMLEQKLKDAKTDDFKVAMKELYVLTIDKFDDPNNTDAQELKKMIENEMSMTPTTTTTTIPSTETTTVDNEDNVAQEAVDPTKRTRREMEFRNKYSGNSKYVEEVPSGTFQKSYDQLVDLVEAQINSQRAVNGLPPIAREQADAQVYMSGSDSFRQAIDVLRGVRDNDDS
tara:strand:+ start:428 stop:1336 length:909 start_codon:yes stop_codon:yes gene_type:complete